ncbi:MAG: ATP-binding protein, partial [Bacteroidota bacterium]
FMLDVVPSAEPEAWLKKQQMVVGGKPTVAGLLLFSDEPQAVLPKRSGIKIYRYMSSAEEGSRDTLDGNTETIEGCLYDMIKIAVSRNASIIESIRVRVASGLEEVAYPVVAIHELVTNAVVHKDYGMTDDIHIRIFDNRLEVISPGSLPEHITVGNIINERFSRNRAIVRMINKFPDPPNKDVGEGLNTAFDAMRNMKPKDPVISGSNDRVIVVLRHEPLATPEELILECLSAHKQIANRDAREICFIGSENKMKRILQGMVKRNILEQVTGTTRYTAAYRLVQRSRPAAPELGPLFDQHDT